METCEQCGAAVGDPDRHRQWHARVDDVIRRSEEQAAAEAQMGAVFS